MIKLQVDMYVHIYSEITDEDFERAMLIYSTAAYSYSAVKLNDILT